MKSPIRKAACFVLGLFGIQALPALAAQDMVLCVEGIPGESQLDKFVDCIDVLAWSWGLSNASQAGGGGTGKANFQDLSVTKWVDKSTPVLILRTADGKFVPSMKLNIVKPCGIECVQPPYYTLEMQDIIVSSVSSGGSGGEDRLTENVTFNFSKVEWCYAEQSKTGELLTPVCYGWDILSNTPF